MKSAGHDAVVIGAGPNGLVAANLLADSGWDVLVLEEQASIGGAVRSDSDVAEGFVHDTFSSFYPLAAASPVIKRLGLERHGLTWCHAPAVLGHPMPDGRWAVLHHEPEQTAAGLDELHPGDGDAWLELYRQWQHIGPALIDALLSPFPPVRASLRMLAKLPGVGGPLFVRTMLEPAKTLAETRFGGEGARLLLAGNASHADIPVDSSGSGLMGLLLAMMGQTDGWPVPQGGAGRLAQALADRFTSLGGEIRCSTPVRRIVVADGRARAVVLADGEQVAFRRAVLADVSAPALYEQLLDPELLPPRVRAGRCGGTPTGGRAGCAPFTRS